MRKTTNGFTIVELLIIIVAIGVLAGIVIVAYNGSRSRAQNTSRVSEMRLWQKTFVQYKAANNGSYPSMADGGYCLGTGFPNQKCREYTTSGSSTYTEATSTALMTALNTYDQPKGMPRVPVKTTVGPYVIYSATQIRIFGVFDGTASSCPSGTIYDWDDGSGRLLCQIILTR